MKYKKNKNLKLRLNLIKRAKLTYIPYQGSVIIIDIKSDGIIVINDNGIIKRYTIDKFYADDILHHKLSGIFYEKFTDTGINNNEIDWKIEFYNRRSLDHIAYGAKDTPSSCYDDVRYLLREIERRLSIDMNSKHISSMCETRNEQEGNPAVFSEEMQSVYFKVMSKLLDKIKEKNGGIRVNVMVSPLSLLFAVAMLFEASDGDTNKEINAFLEDQYDCIAEGLKSVIADSNRTISKLKIANAIYIDDEYMDYVKKSFIQNLNGKVFAELLSADKNSSSRIVNEWVKYKTRGLIKKLVNEDERLDSVALLNSIVFEAEWAEKYDECDIEKELFSNEDGTSSIVSMLHSEESTLLINSKVTGFLKPYKDKEYYFAGLLPNEDNSIKNVLEKMSDEDWSLLFRKARRAKIDVKIPEYKFDYKIDFSEILDEIGIPSIFDQTSSNLRNMISVDGIYVDRVVQKAYIEVSRKGTRASVITGTIVAAGLPSRERYEVYLNRPFIFAIYHSHSGIPVYIGVVRRLDSL